MSRHRYSSRRQRGNSAFLHKLLFMLVICGAIIVVLTMSFRVNKIVVSGQERYTAEQIQEASKVQIGDNLFMLNRHDLAGRIVEKLPYIETLHINRKFPSTLVIEVTECGIPLAVVQDGAAWLISSRGKIIERLDTKTAADFGLISGCTLQSPSVGTKIELGIDCSTQEKSLLELFAALKESEMLESVDGIRLDDPTVIYMDYDGRFTVKMPYEADYVRKMNILQMALESESVQENMTGTFDMMSEDDKAYLVPNER